MENATLYVPTRGRVGLNKQTTIRDLMTFGTVDAWLVCPLEEVDAHKEYWPNTLGCPAEGIGPTRQWLIDQCPTRFVLMFDDDHYYSRRLDDEGMDYEQLRRMDVGEFDLMCQRLYEWMLEGFAHVAISARQGNNRVCNAFKDVARQNNCHGFDTEVFKREGISFCRIPVMEDFDVTLSLLELGYPNRVDYCYCWNQKGSGAEGGCSLYRTAELQAKAAHELQRLHGEDIVKIVTKVSTSQWKDFGERTDVNIQWRKAFGRREAERKFRSYIIPEWDRESYAVKD